MSQVAEPASPAMNNPVDGTESPMRRRMTPTAILGWVAGTAVAAALCTVLFPRAFPLAPGSNWQLRANEAKFVALERFTDLGALPDDSYVSVVLRRQRMLELEMLERAPTDRSPLLADAVLTWLVTAYPSNATTDGWMRQAELTLDGRVVRLLSGVDPDFRSRQQLTIEDAVSRADRLLERSGRQLDDYYDPVERLVEMTNFSYQLLRYERRAPRTNGDAVSENGTTGGVGVDRSTDAAGPRHGVDVQFAGDELLGFYDWEELDSDEERDSNLRRAEQIESAQSLLVFVLLALVVAVFVRRYHQGLVGAKRGTQVALTILVAGFVVLVAGARSVTEGWNVADLSRSATTLSWVGLVSVVYLPAMAVLGGLSFAVGESLARGPWRRRLASFDAFASARWANATVASSSLRGVASGLALLALLLAVAIGSNQYGVRVPLSLQLDSAWVTAPWPGLSLLLYQAVLSTVAAGFSLLFVLQLARQRLSVIASSIVASVVLATLFVAPLVTVPAWGCLPTVLLSSVAIVVLYVRYDFLVAWLAHLIASIGVGALTLIHSGDLSLQVQGLGVLLIAASPLVGSLRYVSTSRRYEYAYDEVPPHVRRIAERERQRVELETAKGIQASILPELPARLRGVEIAYAYQPATEVGGDFYDVIALDDGRLAIAVGDVAGHGVSSGLIMSMVRAALAVQVRFCADVDEVLAALNKVVCGSARKRLLTTVCFAVLDPRSARMTYASAGHIHPYRLSQEGGVMALESTAYPLGVRESLRVDCREVQLRAGDTLVFTTDGLVETRRIGGSELFGFRRFENSLSGLVEANPGDLKNGVLQELERFAAAGGSDSSAESAREDDLTLLVLKLSE